MVVEQPTGAPLRLPAGWVARKSEESGKWYYVNKRSGEASWKVPTAGSWRDRMGFEDTTAAAAPGGSGGGRAMLTAYQLDYPRKELNRTRAQEKFRLAKEMRNVMRGRWAGYSDRNVHRTFETTSKGLFPPPPPPPPATAPEGGSSTGGGRAKQQQQPQPHIAPHAFEGVTTNQAYYKWVWPDSGGGGGGGAKDSGSGSGAGATPAKSGRRSSKNGSVSGSEAPSTAAPPPQHRSSRRTAATAAAAAAASSSSGGGGGPEGGKFVSETTNMAHYTGHPGVGRSGSCRPKERPLMETSPFVATTQYTADFDERAFATGTFRRNALRLHKDHAHLTKFDESRDWKTTNDGMYRDGACSSALFQPVSTTSDARRRMRAGVGVRRGEADNVFVPSEDGGGASVAGGGSSAARGIHAQ